MRTKKLKLMGKEYTLCCSTRCMMAMEERSGSFSSFLDELLKGQMPDKLFALEQLLQAGYVYDTHEGLNPPAPPTMDEIMDCTALDDYPAINEAVYGAITAGTANKVKAENTKNEGGATQAE